MLSVSALPAVVAAVLLPLLAATTFLLEQGSRRGRGLAGFLLTFGASSACSLLMIFRSPSGAPPTILARLIIAFAMLAYIPLLEFLGDLAERSGLDRPAGLPIVPVKRVFGAVMGAVAILILATPWMVPRAAMQAWGAWGPVWGRGMAVPTVVGSAIVAWGVLCWNGERRRRGRAGADLWVWAAAVLLLTGGPIAVGLFVRYLGFRARGPWAPATTVLGGLATLIGLVVSRDLELERLRTAAHSATSLSRPGRFTPAPPGTRTDPNALVLACSGCGAIFRSLTSDGVCPIDGGTVAPSADPMLGAIVDGRYRVLRFLGAGGMARVYATEHTRLGVRFALKVLWGDLLGDRTHVERFLREARAASQLVSRHIVRVHDVGEIQPGQPFLVMELVEGRSLADLLARSGPLRADAVALVGAQLAEGLAVAHGAGVVHRDLKPDNVMVVRLATADAAKIVDFGLAGFIGTAAGPEARLTAAGAIFGTPWYMSPEQVRGEPAGPATDFYALGVTLYEAATGLVPFRGDTPVQVMLKQLSEAPPRVAIDGALGDLIMALLDKDPSGRERAAEGLAGKLHVLAGSATRIESLAAGAVRSPPAPAAGAADTLPATRAP